eukprot:93124-Amorphochlora_amoeboformis.AAC.2
MKTPWILVPTSIRRRGLGMQRVWLKFCSFRFCWLLPRAVGYSSRQRGPHAGVLPFSLHHNIGLTGASRGHRSWYALPGLFKTYARVTSLAIYNSEWGQVCDRGLLSNAS